MSTRADVAMFNKRLFAIHGSVVLTSATRQIMERNAHALSQDISPALTKWDIYAMRCVVDGLKLIHRDQNYVKDILCHTVTLENYATNEYVGESYEIQMSCFYIISGVVQVSYGGSNNHKTRQVHQPDIVYTHSVGEYLGTVSPESVQDDLASPIKICTTEPTELLRIHRDKFHDMMDAYKKKLDADKRSFVGDPRCHLSKVSPDVIEKILPHISKTEVAGNRNVIMQGIDSECMYFVVSDSFFAEECILSIASSSPSFCTVRTTTQSTLFKLNRTALDVVSKEQLHHIVLDNAHQYPRDEELQLLGYRMSVWDQYKKAQIKRVLKEAATGWKMAERQGVSVTKHKTSFQESGYPDLQQRFSGKGDNFVPVVNKPSSSRFHGANSAEVNRPKLMFRNCTSIDGFKRKNISARRNVTLPGNISNEITSILPLHSKSKTKDILRNICRCSYSKYNVRQNSISIKTVSVSRIYFCRAEIFSTSDEKKMNGHKYINIDGIDNTHTDIEETTVLSSNQPDHDGRSCPFAEQSSDWMSLSVPEDETNIPGPVQSVNHLDLRSRKMSQVGQIPEGQKHHRDLPGKPTRVKASKFAGFKVDDGVLMVKAVAQVTTNHQKEQNEANSETNVKYTVSANIKHGQLNMAVGQWQPAFLSRNKETLTRKTQKQDDIKECRSSKNLRLKDDVFDRMVSQLEHTSLILLPRSKSGGIV